MSTTETARGGYGITLVQPPAHHGVQSLFTFHANKGIGVKPPQALMILGTCLKEAGFDGVRLLDAQLLQLTPEETARQVAASAPRMVGLTVWTDFWYSAWLTAKLLRDLLPEATIVLGGPHCTIFPRETLLASAADYVLAGEGDEVLVNLAVALAEGRQPEAMPGLWRRQGPTEILEPPVALAQVADIDLVPIPDRTLLSYRRYGSVLNSGTFETTMITSRGCPHKCIFCKMFSQTISVRSASRVVEEFRQIAELGIRDIQVYDDTFTWSKQRVMEICQGILDLKLDVHWAIRDRVNRADQEMYCMLRRAGCYRIHFGVESGSQPILSASGKGITLEQAHNAVQLAKAAGMDTLAFYMFGFPGETRKDALKTIAFAKRLNTDYAAFAVLIPYPGTKIYEDSLANGTIPEDFWRRFTLNPKKDFVLPGLVEDVLRRDELIRLKNRAQYSYYFRPVRIWRELKTVNSPQALLDKSAMAWNIVSDLLRGGARSKAGQGE